MQQKDNAPLIKNKLHELRAWQEEVNELRKQQYEITQQIRNLDLPSSPLEKVKTILDAESVTIEQEIRTTKTKILKQEKELNTLLAPFGLVMQYPIDEMPDEQDREWGCMIQE